MKKSIISVILIAMIALTGCSSSEAFTGEKVGEVVADSGDKTIATVKFENGEPVDVDIDVETKDGMKSQLSKDGSYDRMNDGMKWHEQADALEDMIIAENFDLAKITIDDSGKTDAITGVSIDVDEYLEAIQKALNQVK